MGVLSHSVRNEANRVTEIVGAHVWNAPIKHLPQSTEEKKFRFRDGFEGGGKWPEFINSYIYLFGVKYVRFVHPIWFGVSGAGRWAKFII